AVSDRGTYAEAKKLIDDLALCCSCFVCPRSTPPGILHREMKRGRSRLVPESRTCARLQQEAYRRGAARPHCSVQGSRTVLILCIHTRAGREQTLDGLYLPLGI